MVEYKTLAFEEIINYKGLIDVKETYTLMNKWFTDRGYDHNEVFNMQHVYEDFKQITIETRPYKKISDYAKIEFKIEIAFSKLKEKVVERNGIKHKLMHGEANFIFTTYLVTDREGMWTSKPMYFLLRNLMERFLYRSYISRYEDEALSDKKKVMREIKSFLNMEKLK
ncbi:MAG: hypothetical protein ACMXX7_00485 [Candidatus Woesearchaeota archaeon]